MGLQGSGKMLSLEGGNIIFQMASDFEVYLAFFILLRSTSLYYLNIHSMRVDSL